jgi:hypothetical protein
MIIDGTDLEILRPPLPPELENASHAEQWEFYKLWYSHKLNTTAIKYELGVHVKTGKIVWFHGPFRGATADISIFRDSLMTKLVPREMVMADLGYCGTISILTAEKGSAYKEIRRTPEDKIFNSVRSKIERTIGRIKFFNICHTAFRNSLASHRSIFDVVCRLTNVNLIFEPLLSKKGERALGYRPEE